MTIIVDTSVAIKWFVTEEGSSLAEKLLKDIIEGETTAISTDLFFYEVGNVLLNKKQPKESLHAIAEQLIDIGIIIKPIVQPLFETIYSLAQQYTISFYDASYIVLAQEEDCPFITADKKLYMKMTKDFSHIQLL